MQTTGDHPTPGAAPFHHRSELRQRHLIEQLTHAILFETLLILALIVFALYQQYKLSAGQESAQQSNPPEQVAVNPPVIDQPPSEGERIFDTKCASCHTASYDNGTGPGLKGVRNRIPKGDWIYRWIKNPGAMIDSGDPYAVQLYKKYAPTRMPAQNLTDEEIDAVINFLGN